MANLLTITKEADGYFTFVLNGDSANAIKNIRNDLLTVGNLAHFKTANGANLIKEQDVIYSNITIIDGASSIVPTSVDDLFNELDTVGFFDWINGSGGSGGVDRYEELIDTEPFFGNDGKVPIVDEAEMILKYTSLPDVSYLDNFPNPIVAGKMLIGKSDASGYEFIEAINVVTQEIREGETTTTPSEDAIFQALATKANTADIPNSLPEQLDFEANGVDNFIDIGTAEKAKLFFYNSVLQTRDVWEQANNIVTFTFTPDSGEGYKNLTFI